MYARGRIFSGKGMLLALFVSGLSACQNADAARPLSPTVESEELVYNYESANNGAGPMWCYGSTCMARIGKDLFASGIETLKDVKPLNNVRWMLFKQEKDGWKLQQADERGRTREPCPLGVFSDGRLFLSVNPTLAKPTDYNGPADPQVLEFSAAKPRAPFRTLHPKWDGKPAFTEHSYRGFAADGPNRELLLLNILGHKAQYWSFRGRDGKWSKCGKLDFPMGVEYEKPELIRLCYPEVALRDRAAHVLAVSDIIEPVKAWREYKLILHNGKKWDYDFRRLFYSWTPDITTAPFSKWIEIASREKTCGLIRNLDLWLDAKGRAHVLWLEQSIWDTRVRDKFFPDVPITWELKSAVIDKGTVGERVTILAAEEKQPGFVPQWGRFQATPDGRLFVFYCCNGNNEKGKRGQENRLVELLPDGGLGEAVRVPLQHPFTNFMTATERGGSPPSNELDALGTVAGKPGIWHARIRLFARKP